VSAQHLTRAVWKKSTRSGSAGGGDSNCVEVADIGDGIAVRDSKEPAGSVVFSPARWSAFIAGVKANEFDLTSR
jgi:hypothetical protein